MSLASLVGWAWWRIKKARSGGKHQDPLLIKEKVSRIAYEAELEVTSVLSQHGTESRARELLRNAASPTGATTAPPGSASRWGRSGPPFRQLLGGRPSLARPRTADCRLLAELLLPRSWPITGYPQFLSRRDVLGYGVFRRPSARGHMAETLSRLPAAYDFCYFHSEHLLIGHRCTSR